MNICMNFDNILPIVPGSQKWTLSLGGMALCIGKSSLIFYMFVIPNKNIKWCKYYVLQDILILRSLEGEEKCVGRWALVNENLWLILILKEHEIAIWSLFRMRLTLNLEKSQIKFRLFRSNVWRYSQSMLICQARLVNSFKSLWASQLFKMLRSRRTKIWTFEPF